MIKFKVSEEYQEKLRRDEIILKLQYRIKQIQTFRKVFNIRRIQIEGPRKDSDDEGDDDSDLQSSSREVLNSVVREESSNIRSDAH